MFIKIVDALGFVLTWIKKDFLKGRTCLKEISGV